MLQSTISRVFFGCLVIHRKEYQVYKVSQKKMHSDSLFLSNEGDMTLSSLRLSISQCWWEVSFRPSELLMDGKPSPQQLQYPSLTEDNPLFV